ncbi:MAG: EamA family transporter [Eubacteriales bacterium]
MIGYLYVAGALAAGVTKGYCGKKTSGVIRTTRSTLLFNAVRMLLCIPIGFLFVLTAGATGSLTADGTTLFSSLLSGLSTALFVVTWIGCVRWGAYMMVDVFVTLGILIPMLFSAICFGEPIRLVHLLGLVLLIFAAYLMCTYHKKLSDNTRKIGIPQYLLLFLCGISNGITQFAQKWFRYACDTDISVFNFYTYVVAAAVLLLCFLFCNNTSSDTEQINTASMCRLAVYVLLMSACLFFHSYCSTAAAGYLSSSQLYPLMQGSALILSMLMSAVCFGERITVRSILGIVSAFAAMLCINLL